ncbi:hypothetical protein [Nocardia abscessus]|uniref:hypothetical protein n=1 Tax=Nocardia abscessus TaxID=120957 RepID=UPI002456CF67|nr:hypothetical protein [Nocardia abscessus]
MSNSRVYLTKAAADSLPGAEFYGLVRDPADSSVVYFEAKSATVTDDDGWLAVTVVDKTKGSRRILLPPTAVAAVVRL